MSDEQHETSRPTAVERIPLAELYEALPDYVAGTEEPFDIQAGFAQLHAWIDEREADAVQQPPKRGAIVDLVPHNVRIYDDPVALMKIKDADVQVALAEIEGRRRASERAQLHAEKMESILHAQKMELIRHRDKLEIKRSQLQVDAKLRARTQAGRLIVQTVASLTAAVSFILSIMYNVAEVSLVVVGLAVTYGVILLAASTAAMQFRNIRRQNAGARVLRLMLFREDIEPRSRQQDIKPRSRLRKR